MSEPTTLPALMLIGDNPTLLWGMTNAERLRRLARAEGLPDTPPASGAQLSVNLDYVFDPVWLRHILTLPGTVVMDGDALVMAHLTGGMTLEDIASHRDALTIIDYRDNPQIYNRQLRKLECPFIQRLTPDTRREIERKSYFGAYKGVTDLLTKYLWPELALWLTRIAASIGMTPNMVTAIGAALCIYATYLFAYGHYWTGMLAAFIFMVFDTVDGKLARCTITSSKWGNVADHGVDLIHPPFWWYFWGVGLGSWGLRAIRSDLPAGDDRGRRGLCAPARDRGDVHQGFRHGRPCLAAVRQPVPPDHRAAQSEYRDPVLRDLGGSPRHRADRGRLVDDHLAGGPCGAVGAGLCCSGAPAARSSAGWKKHERNHR